MRAIVSLGSNQGNREEFLSRARDALAMIPKSRFLFASSIRETEPVDVPSEFSQLKFLNQLVVLDTDLSPEEFSSRMHKIEDSLGRVRTVVNGPRTIDLDLIDFGGLVRDDVNLTLPHPRAKNRDFILTPLQEIGAFLGESRAEIDLVAIREELSRGARVLLLTRHAERPKINNEDPSFGGDLSLTEEGRRTSFAFGEALRGATDDIEFRASPLSRTVQTACEIASGIGIASPKIIEDAKIGNGSAFIANEREVWELFRDGIFFEKMFAYFASGNQRGFAPLAIAADQFEAYLTSHWSSRLAIFASHDVYLAAFLMARGVAINLTQENWPRFLDAVAIIEDPNKTRRYAFVRTGFSNRICGV